INNVAPMSSISDSAISATTSTACARRLSTLADPLRPPSLSGRFKSTRDPCSAGANPKRIPVVSESSSVNDSTFQSSTTTSTPRPLGPPHPPHPYPTQPPPPPPAPPLPAAAFPPAIAEAPARGLPQASIAAPSPARVRQLATAAGSPR